MATRIPITKDTSGGGMGFEDRQKRIWEDMEADMERRRREWEDEIEKMRKEFFMLRPEGEAVQGLRGPGGAGVLPGLGMGPRSRLLESSGAADDSRGMVVKDEKGNPVFKVLFDVHEYRPEEVSVKMDAHKIMVSAKHEAKQGGSSVSREYSREVQIPHELDPMTLQCTMGPDGILAVEAPIPAPSYAAVRDATLPVRTGSPASSSSATGGSITGIASVTPLQQSSSSTSSSSYQTSYNPQQQLPPPPPQRGAGLSNHVEPALPAGFKPVSAPFLQTSAPPPQPSSSTSSSSMATNAFHNHHPHQQQQSSPPQPQMTSVSSKSSQHSSYSSRNDTGSPLLSQGMGGAASAKTSPPQFHAHMMGSQQTPPPTYSPPIRQPTAGGGGLVGAAQGPHMSGVGASSSSSNVTAASVGRIGSPVVSTENPGQFRLEIDIEDFKPEELTVKTQDKRVLVCARRQVVQGNRASTRELSREHTIPDTVDPLTIKAFFTDTGKLIVEAPYVTR